MPYQTTTRTILKQHGKIVGCRHVGITDFSIELYIAEQSSQATPLNQKFFYTSPIRTRIKPNGKHSIFEGFVHPRIKVTFNNNMSITFKESMHQTQSIRCPNLDIARENDNHDDIKAITKVLHTILNDEIPDGDPKIFDAIIHKTIMKPADLRSQDRWGLISGIIYLHEFWSTTLRRFDYQTFNPKRRDIGHECQLKLRESLLSDLEQLSRKRSLNPAINKMKQAMHQWFDAHLKASNTTLAKLRGTYNQNVSAKSSSSTNDKSASKRLFPFTSKQIIKRKKTMFVFNIARDITESLPNTPLSVTSSHDMIQKHDQISPLANTLSCSPDKAKNTKIDSHIRSASSPIKLFK